MKSFRKVIFWIHLVTGLIAGLAIAIMSFTGVLLAFETEIVEWTERDARRVEVPAAAKALPLSDLQARLREAQPELPFPAITLRNDPSAAIMFSAGREGGFYVDPYTGEIRQPASTKVHDFLHVMLAWHRYLGRDGESRPAGKLINGICNLAFFGLAVTGLYIWWPRHWSWRGVKAVALFNWRLSGKARDFNWHNVIGLWSAPVLIVLTLTAVPISFRWGGNLIYRLVGEEPPAPGGGASSSAQAPTITRPFPDARPLGYDPIVANVQQEFPKWEQINLRSGALQRAARPAGAGAAGAPRPAGPGPDTARRAGESSTSSQQPRETPGNIPPEPQPLTVTIREAGSWPRTATTTLTLNPFTGDVLKREGFGDLSTALQIRRWTRFLHTGEALGWGGQLVAGLASLGGLFLVYTGFALAWRRFFVKRKLPPASSIAGKPDAELVASGR